MLYGPVYNQDRCGLSLVVSMHCLHYAGVHLVLIAGTNPGEHALGRLEFSTVPGQVWTQPCSFYALFTLCRCPSGVNCWN